MYYLSFLQTFLSVSFLGFNWLDVIILAIIGFYLYEGYQLGFILAFLDLLSFILSFAIALKGYGILADILMRMLGLPIGFANACGFFILALVVEVILNLLFRRLVYRRLIPKPGTNVRFDTYRKADHLLGIIPGIASGLILVAFILILIVSLPTSALFKQLIDNSRLGSLLVSQTAAFEGKVNEVFGGAFHETMSFLTVEPKSNQTIQLHFTVNGTVDRTAEAQMLQMVNKERSSRGIPTLTLNTQLTNLARSYAKDMFERGYFSHYNPEGQSPFDRMQAAGIDYTAAGENLALAPSTDLAMQGLMNSPGHKANILSPDFHKVGIGVIDGGIYGELFDQEFTN